ncbi:hypothetical protein, partial [Ferrovum sp.]|uniref:hypothetical protein n=1 Tax=Ferrovum sp. TaxID=2609467 RepID=UPI00262531E5
PIEPGTTGSAGSIKMVDATSILKNAGAGVRLWTTTLRKTKFKHCKIRKNRQEYTPVQVPKSTPKIGTFWPQVDGFIYPPIYTTPRQIHEDSHQYSHCPLYRR